MIEDEFCFLLFLLGSSLFYCLHLLEITDGTLLFKRKNAPIKVLANYPIIAKKSYIPPDYVDKDVLLYHDDKKLLNFWTKDPFEKKKGFSRIIDCPLVRSCRVTFTEREAKLADAILLMAGAPKNLRRTKVKSDKPVVAVITEHDVDETCPSYMEEFDFDYRFSYKSSADVWAPLECKSTLAMLNGDINKFEKSFQNRTGNVLAMISNCSSKKRNRWIEGLMEAGLNIDHYGECWHNHNEFSYYDEELDWERKRKIAESYRFVIAFENKVEKDYVTEKPFDAYMAGAIPIYWGAPNVDEYLPEGSFVDARDFATPKELANFVNHLIDNPWKQLKYKQWDRDVYRTSKYGRSCQYSSKCLVCWKAISEWKENPGSSACDP